jgi:hypothetical protein
MSLSDDAPEVHLAPLIAVAHLLLAAESLARNLDFNRAAYTTALAQSLLGVLKTELDACDAWQEENPDKKWEKVSE